MTSGVGKVVAVVAGVALVVWVGRMVLDKSRREDEMRRSMALQAMKKAYQDRIDAANNYAKTRDFFDRIGSPAAREPGRLGLPPVTYDVEKVTELFSRKPGDPEPPPRVSLLEQLVHPATRPAGFSNSWPKSAP